MKFFFDNCVSPRHADGLLGFAGADGHHFEHLCSRFERHAEDPVWLAELGKERGWIIVSGDTRILTSPLNRKAWVESKLTGFFFCEPFNNDAYWKQAEALVHWWPLIARQAKKTPAGHGFKLPKKGKELHQVYP